ncbi:hypothetical protein AWW67_01310 [Roseivirga seohaensis]|uniref:PqqD family protein n=1 Tax=Roseivirga seohaensis TaxID=1914963 RepID=A0A150Y103_9BACT|nr:PqqD family peptide modification chaperone [Roseivirga seohaensis]KYG84710.1 hypothetical protein AWW67_01310 [Roseivirga seohaensis]
MQRIHISKTELVSRNPEIIFSIIDNEVIIMDIKTDRYIQLDTIASDIWNILSEELSIENLCKILQAKYDVSEEECFEHVNSFLIEMWENNFIKIN